MEKLHADAKRIIEQSIMANLPGAAVQNALREHSFTKNTYLVAIGKAAWTMAQAACETLGDRLIKGVVVTKYGHARGALANMEIVEAGHPISDENTLIGTQKAIDLAKGLTAADELLFLISGGGSALFEKPLPGITLQDIANINNQLLACGADIVEINRIRKRLSAVKAGRFAKMASPAKLFTIVLSDVLGNRLDSIASGPAVPDQSTAEEAQRVLRKYNLQMPDAALRLLLQETPKALGNVTTIVTGSVSTLCTAAAQAAKALGYTPYVLCDDLCCEAKEAGRMLSSIAKGIGRAHGVFHGPCAIILGGETVVHIKGKGKGGRNQELALAAAEGIAGQEGVVIFSVGSDGTDGPTDAAGGIVDGMTTAKLKKKGIAIQEVLEKNDSYHALKAADGLIITGPTGTNVNDIAVILHG